MRALVSVLLLLFVFSFTSSTTLSQTVNSVTFQGSNSLSDGLGAKDVLTICISMLALSLSILSTIITVRQKKFETERTLRTQLSDVLGKITALNLELAKIPQHGISPSGLTPNMRGHLRDQLRFLVRQATYITDQIDQLVSPFEFLLIAGAFADINEVYQAERFFQKAIERTGEDQINFGIITRGFARFLFNTGEHEQARQQYAGALEIFSGDTDIMKEYRGDTYFRWANQEFEWSYVDEARSLFERAQNEFFSKANPIARRQNLERLNDHLNKIFARQPAENKDSTTEVRREDDDALLTTHLVDQKPD